MGDDGFHNFSVNGTIFKVPLRYECESSLGSGAYGVVCSAADKSHNGAMVAIKKLSKSFQDLYSAKKLVRELRLLKHFSGNENVIGLLDVIQPPDVAYDEVYVVTDLLDCDLKYCLKHKSSELGEDHYKYFLSQILSGVEVMHRANVIHRDLKPENIFVKADCSLKIGDLGLARDNTSDEDKSQYVVTRWYRAPELIMNWEKYGGSIDIWSVGCIFAEMISINHRPIFPGTNPREQLDKILRVLGRPDPEDYSFVTSNLAREYVSKFPAKAREDLVARGFLPQGTSPDAIDFLFQALAFNPQKRPSAKELKTHRYIFDDDDEEEEEEEEEEVAVFSPDFANHMGTVDEAKLIVNTMIKFFHPEFQGPVHPQVPAETAAPDRGQGMFAVAEDGEVRLCTHTVCTYTKVTTHSHPLSSQAEPMEGVI